MNVSQLLSGKYIIAVSGGVDSVVLLDYISRYQKDVELIVAHFDHGIREDTADDVAFVTKLAKQYGVPYEIQKGELGVGASEEMARIARYHFLRDMKEKHTAQGIITAHHANDVVETMILNLIRGTGWRGLCSLRNTEELHRPLLQTPKSDILTYAEKEGLSWREDSTNRDMKYLRNNIRQNIMPRVDLKPWLELFNKQLKLRNDIDIEVKNISSRKRYDFIMWPQAVALEVLRKEINITRPQAMQTLLGIKTGREGNVIEIAKDKKITLTRDSFIVL